MTLLALAVSGRGIAAVDEPVLHADDEAFLRGRAAFETLRVYGGLPFKLESHLVRLSRSCERIGIEPPDAEEARELASLALAHTQERNVVLRLYRTSRRTRRACSFSSTPFRFISRTCARGASSSSRCSASAPRLRGCSAGSSRRATR